MSNGKTFEGLEKSVRDTIQEIKKEVEIDEKIKELDQEALRDLEDALKYIDENGGLIDDLRRIKFPNSQNNVSHEDLEHEMQAIKKSYNVDPSSKQATETLRNEMQQIHNDLGDALEALKEKDEALKELGREDRNLEKKISMIEDNQKADIKKALERLNKYKGQ